MTAVYRTGLFAVLLAALIFAACGTLAAAPAPEQQAYWWMDELRTVAFALSEARSGKIATWPRMTVPAGAATLPVPKADGPVTADGAPDEPAWATATRFQVGPVFGPWAEGPMVLYVSACRDEKTLYLAIESPRDLAPISALGGAGELFSVDDKPYAFADLPKNAVRTTTTGQTIELALPLAKPNATVVITFEVELAQHRGGKLPPEMTALGLARHVAPNAKARRTGAVWLEPITVTLVPADAAARLSLAVNGAGDVRLIHQAAVGKVAPQAGETPLKAQAESGVYRYDWRTQVAGRVFSLEGFAYLEPVAETLSAARNIAARAGAPAALLEEAGRAPSASPADRAAWRSAYCAARALRSRAHLAMLDAPLLVVKRHPYMAAHIYDDYATWRPGGGIYVLENPAAPFADRKIRTMIDAGTDPTLGAGIYRDPDLSPDARRIVFAYKGAANGFTNVYEIGLDGRNLRRLTQSDEHHDLLPAYLPDGRIVFLSTRPRGRVPCFNNGVTTLHTMDADGKNIRPISSNNVTEFDPAVLPDGRILYGRWEYVDKTALYMQSLWTVFPDGTNETALFANNLARPTAVLDARPVPGTTNLIAASLTPHNGQSVGAIAIINPELGKNNLAAITNLTPEYPTEMDQGLAVGPNDPWPLSENDVLIANNAIGAHGIIELIDRFGHRELVLADPEISCYAPKLMKPHTAPPQIAATKADDNPGRFLILDIYQGLAGVKRGEVKRLRLLEETTRTSDVPPGGRWWNQAFLVSWQGAYVVKNFLGTVPVESDGSVYFEAPAGRALYFEALDADGREVQRMRTFVQAVPGVTRSCVGCHEPKLAAPAAPERPPAALARAPSKPAPESWGTGFVDYPTQVQPILDKQCVRCHGGADGIAGGVDLTGGWTWAFSISYETLLKNNFVGFVRCNNADTTSSDILPPRTIGSGAAPLGKILMEGHNRYVPGLTRAERDLVMAWMDANSSYYGTYDYTPHATCNAILECGKELAAEMKAAGCTKCHAEGHVGNDWGNLKDPALSRILRAPLAAGEGGMGLGWCRDRKAAKGLPLVTQSHLPPDVFRPPTWPKPDASGEARPTFASPRDPHYEAMLKIIRRAQSTALAAARVDMPGAEIVAGACRMQAPLPLPATAPPLAAKVEGEDVVELSWPRSAETIGLEFEVYRGDRPDFAPSDATRVSRTVGFRLADLSAPPGEQYYALVLFSGDARSTPQRAAVRVPQPPPPPSPKDFTSTPQPGSVALEWQPAGAVPVRYNVYRAPAGSQQFAKLTPEPIGRFEYADADAEPGAKYAYAVRAVSRRGAESEPTPTATAAALPDAREPVFQALFAQDLDGRLLDSATAKGARQGAAAIANKALDLGKNGYVSFEHRKEFDLGKRFSLELWVRLDTLGAMPVIAACGHFNAAGWFLQRYGGGWRWHVGGVSCDGGKPAAERWTHLVCTFDGKRASLYQDGTLVASTPCSANLAPYNGPMHIGQYATVGEPYQTQGQIAGVKIYGRALAGSDAAEAFKAGCPAQNR